MNPYIDTQDPADYIQSLFGPACAIPNVVAQHFRDQNSKDFARDQRSVPW